MKSIPNLTFTIPGVEKNETTASLVKICLQSQPQGGFDFKTMKGRLRVEAVLEKAEEGGTIELEDADYDVAVQAIKETRWVNYGKHLIQFGEQFGL